MSATPTYSPTPGTVAFRAISHLEARVAPGGELSTAALAEAIGAPPTSIMACLEAARVAGLVFARRKGGAPRSPLFWSLTDHGEQMPAFPGASVESLDIDAVHRKHDGVVDMEASDQSTVAKLPPLAVAHWRSDDQVDVLMHRAPIDAEISEQPAAAALIAHLEDGEAPHDAEPPAIASWKCERHNRWSLIGRDCPQCSAGASTMPREAAPAVADASIAESEVIERNGPTQGDQARYERAREGMESALCESVADRGADGAPALATLPHHASPVGGPMGARQPAAAGPPGGLRIALWSDGTLQIERPTVGSDFDIVLLPKHQVRQLVDYLDAICLDLLSGEAD